MSSTAVIPIDSIESVYSRQKLGEIKAALKLPGSCPDVELVKFTRQLNFAASQDACTPSSTICLDNLTKTFVHRQQQEIVLFPKTRFGKTELNVSILTCGGMRFQETWCPDTLPILGSRSPLVGFGMSAIGSDCQNNLEATIKRALSLGINHFETARAYGTSEMQVAAVFSKLIASGEISRSDFILQTKLPPSATLAEFKKHWKASWSLFSCLGYIDLLSVHGINLEKNYKWVFENGENSLTPFLRSLVEAGHARHLGFATHGSPTLVRKVLMQDFFSYVNLHSHGVFGDYHGSGCPDRLGGFGHRANIGLAKDKDMGVFIISPFDKGGKLYCPSTKLSQILGPSINAIEFQAAFQWLLGGCDTIVIGASRPSDFDEVHDVLRHIPLAAPETADLIAEKVATIQQVLDDACGPGGLQALYTGLPDLDDPRANGIAIAHMVWLWVLITGLGLFEYAQERFANLESTAASWSSKKSAEENIDAWGFNPGRAPLSEEEELPAEALKVGMYVFVCIYIKC